MKVAQLMNQVVFTCRPEDTLEEAAQLMWAHDCGSLPVVDAESKVVGMITDRDICMGAFTQGRALWDLRVAATMARKVHACRAEDPIALAEAHMREHQVHRLPVLDAAGKPVGILSLNDIACEAQREIHESKRAARLEEVGGTLAAICRPRAKKPTPSTNLSLKPSVQSALQRAPHLTGPAS